MCLLISMKNQAISLRFFFNFFFVSFFFGFFSRVCVCLPLLFHILLLPFFSPSSTPFFAFKCVIASFVYYDSAPHKNDPQVWRDRRGSVVLLFRLLNKCGGNHKKNAVVSSTKALSCFAGVPLRQERIPAAYFCTRKSIALFVYFFFFFLFLVVYLFLFRLC